MKNSLSQESRIGIEVTDLVLNTKITYNSMHEAAKALSINHQSISNYFNYKQTTPYIKRYIFKQVTLKQVTIV